ncbi:ABC transporter ATP-binding protein [Xenorhabdus mauleonii]|uniref:ABC transporter ATP-binding protein n=1 Tax=Xenorhabdus mauleonii TaxID=351675 RepID=A0A1I3T985_9GAMM|nr:ABC-F family ATP-binding cassette domain-containing protein [Xenorhabdus mauleonii]PHM39366.1 ABC transporter ATP-binding protein [Xenorhabdus mauleonii]SFJ66331.1 ATPase components of ABC transporters with duplicated ATPase domains [Xenorhabdus mauleonii]
MSTLLSAKSICYDTSTTTLLNDVSFTVQAGDRIGLIGHNGSGKSTLLKLLTAQLAPNSGTVHYANHCVPAYIEQHLPEEVESQPLVEAVLQKLPADERMTERWRAEVLLTQLGFSESLWTQAVNQLSGGQHTRLLLGRALIQEPDLLLLDEPSNHLDLPTLWWLRNFLQSWKGSFILVSHDQTLLDETTNCTWILRDKTLHFYRLPCSEARQALAEKDVADEHRNQSEQKEIDRITISAKRLATWGQVYDNESFSRKAKQMEKHIQNLKDTQTALTEGYQWRLTLTGQTIQADRVLELDHATIKIPGNATPLFTTRFHQVRSGDRIAIIGANGCGKSTFLQLLWQLYLSEIHHSSAIKFHPAIAAGYYDQQLHQLHDNDTLTDALRSFAPLTDEQRKMALIGAGFAYPRHQQKVATLSGGERSRLLFVGLSLAKYELVMMDEPTNHLDIEGKEALCEQIATFAGALLVVSHDRWLIENSCQRFWFINNNQLEEYHDVEAIYQQIEQMSQLQNKQEEYGPYTSQTANNGLQPSLLALEEQLLERLFHLEERLDADLKRKITHQKPHLQQQWAEEIEKIQSQLNL